MSQPHNALIFIALDLVGGEAKAKNILSQILECGTIEAISSVYKRYLTDARVDLRARMEFVIRLETVMSVDQCLHMVLTVEKDQAELTLLAFDDVILMSPRLTLPYPAMHTDSLIIRCAAEAWGQYEHPIFQKTLSEISRTASSARMAEFYIQGKSLVDF